MTIDERTKALTLRNGALTMREKLISRAIEEIRAMVKNLVRVAEIRDRLIIEGPNA